jgi:hypothetical protein
MEKSLSSEIGLHSKLPTFFKNCGNTKKKGYSIINNMQKNKN